MVMATIVLQHQENHLAPSSIKATSSQRPSGREKAAINLAKSGATQNFVGPIHDACELLNMQRHEREEEA